MPRLRLSLVFGFLLNSLWPHVRPAQAKDQPPSPEQIQFFESRVRPTLTDHCAKCHGAEKQKAGLRVDSRGALLA
ncbi:c-type cytochrome domain-containing protein, partial [Singulisphaera rosea]